MTQWLTHWLNEWNMELFVEQPRLHQVCYIAQKILVKNRIAQKSSKIIEKFWEKKSRNLPKIEKKLKKFHRKAPEFWRIFNLFQIGFFQCFSYIIDRVHQNSPSMHFRRANTDSGGPIRNQEGQYRFRRANTDFRKVNTEPSMRFRRANTEIYCK